MKDTSIKWRFRSNGGGDIDGISDPGIESFKGTPLKSLAREICQNSLDAQKDTNEPVIVEFSLFEVPTAKIPGINNLIETPLEKGLKFWSIQNNGKAKKFYENALAKLGNKQTKVLRISDYNTEGLMGCKEKVNSPFINLVKSSGASDKKGSKGGAFGIGKYATFACSDIRTVFYSTVNMNGEEAYLGVSRLASFYLSEDDIAQGVCFYANGESNSPVYEQFSLNNKIKRKLEETGTDIYIMAFKSFDENWENEIIGSVIDGFLYAIYDGNLIFKINDIYISKENLDTIFNQYSESIPDNAKDYYSVLKNEDTKWFETDYCNMGTIKLGLLLNPSLHSRKIAMIRKTGMKIFDKGGINAQILFAGLLLIEGENINAYLKSLENPQHTLWEPDRDPDENKHYAERIISGITRFIKEKLNELKGDTDIDQLDSGLGNFLPYDSGESETKRKKDILSIDEIEIKTTEKDFSSKTKNPSVISNSDNAIESSGNITGTSSGNKNNDGKQDKKDSSGNGNNNLGKIAVKDISIQKTRIIAIDKTNGKYIIRFIPESDSESACIQIMQAAENDSYPAEISKVSIDGYDNCCIDKAIIKNVKFKKNVPVIINLEIFSHDYSSFEVTCYEYE